LVAGFAEGDHLGSSGNAWHASNNIRPYPPLKIVKSHGFQLQSFYRGMHGQIQVKPGYLAKAPGARMVFEVDTAFEDVPNAGDLVEVLLTYVTSYDNWGKASISCISGCTCHPSVIDALAQTHTSLNALFTMRASRHPKCRIQVKVLPETSSKGHHFKVVNVVTRIEESVGA
jgi:hypothetical protein